MLLTLNTALLGAIALVPAAFGQLALWWWAVRRRLVVQGLTSVLEGIRRGVSAIESCAM